MTRGTYRTADGQAQIEWELNDGERGPEFSASGQYRSSDGGNLGGQCIDDIAKLYPDDAMVKRIAPVWSAYHLNGMNAGTREQSAEIERQTALATIEHPDCLYPEGGVNMHALSSKLIGKMDAYTLTIQWLKDAGLYEVPATTELKAAALGGFDGDVYRYGERWLYYSIPASVIDEIKSWGTSRNRPLHKDQAAQFLGSHGLKLRATQKGDKCPPFCEGVCTHGDRYRITISRKGGGRLAFDFWNSQNDMQAGKAPDAYSVLSCVSSDVHCPETLEDFCGEYGYEPDSIKTAKTWRRCLKFAERIQAFFGEPELEELSAIR